MATMQPCSPGMQIAACLTAVLWSSITNILLAHLQVLIRTELLNCIKDEKAQTISKKVRNDWQFPADRKYGRWAIQPSPARGH